MGKLPFIPVVNKSDLEWELSDGEIKSAFSGFEFEPLTTSAKTGENVELAFKRLAARLVE
jgi:50S ribosomal subunit-associated GTPase HflX